MKLPLDPTGSKTARTLGDASDRAHIDRLVSRMQQDLREEARSLTRFAAALSPLTREKTYIELTKLPALLDTVEKKLGAIPHVEERSREILDEVRRALSDRRRDMQENLARDLRSTCESRGIGFRVVHKDEPVELRIPPFAVLIDREKGCADLRFARISLTTCAADAAAIVATHQRVLESLRAGFDADQFFSACHKAWLAARGAGDAGAGDRVEILDFLPYLAMQMQRRAFRVEPSARNYRDYGRARFAFDMLRLRSNGGLVRSGWRINLGVATGTTASKKNRVIWFEDEHGEGEFKLTVFFTRQGGDG